MRDMSDQSSDDRNIRAAMARMRRRSRPDREADPPGQHPWLDSGGDNWGYKPIEMAEMLRCSAD